MLKLRELDLELAFFRMRALRENVEDQRGAIENFALEDFLQIARLSRGEFIVENDRINVVPATLLGEMPRLAAANEGPGDRRLKLLHALAHDFTPGACSQLAQFGHRILDLP